jgi:hypothetical protein
MSSSLQPKFAWGKVAGTGALIKVSVPEFTPQKVTLRNITSDDSLEWVQPMANGAGLKKLKAGAQAMIASGGVTPVTQHVLSDGADPGRGFTIGTDTDINVSAEMIYWEAWG